MISPAALSRRKLTWHTENHVHRRPADRMFTASNTSTGLNSSTSPTRSTKAITISTSQASSVPAVPSDSGSIRKVNHGLLEPPGKCETCKMEFQRPHLFCFHQERHEKRNLMAKTRTHQTAKSSPTVSVRSSAVSHASSKTFVQQSQPWDCFPQCGASALAQRPQKAADVFTF